MTTATQYRSFDFPTRLPALLGGMLLLLAFGLGLAPNVASAQTTYNVGSTGDSGNDTLRDAINTLNDGSGTPADTIKFSIGGAGPHTIQLQSQLPPVTDPVVIDGTSEPGYSGSPVVEIDGENLVGTGADGIIFRSVTGGSVKGLSIVGFFSGVKLNGADDITIARSYIGVGADSAATSSEGHNQGIDITNGASSNTVEDNVISNNGYGIRITSGNNNVITGNKIGTDPTGTTVVGNNSSGVRADGVSGTRIGVDASGTVVDGNLISGNGDGIVISGGDAIIQGNRIGTNADGDAALGNGVNGIEIRGGASGVQVGGSALLTDEGNVISGNGDHGVLISGSNTSNITLENNTIGTDEMGKTLLGNGKDGVRITGGSSNNTIGGAGTGIGSVTGNVIAGNRNEIFIAGSDNTVQGNWIGTNANGRDLGSDFNALRISSGSDNQIGGSVDGAGNVIAFTETDAVLIDGSTNTFRGNSVGTNRNDDQLGGHGTIKLKGSGHTIGAVGDGANTIAYTSNGTVAVAEGTGHTITGNRMIDNDDLGIDLGTDGRTANDADDADTGPNTLHNFPEILSTGYNSSTNEVTVTYQVPSDPSNSNYLLTIDFYKADADGDAGKAYLGTDVYEQSDYGSGGCSTAPCPVTTTFTPEASVSASDRIVATVTDGTGNTSEFSPVSSPLPVELASFEATQSGDRSVELTWTTASETNNAGFVVQRREARAPGDGAWATIGRVDGAGTTTEAQTYRFTAEDLAVGTHEFRLKQVDLDGTMTVHDPVSVEVQMQQALRLAAPAPNPVQDRATLSFAVQEQADTRLTLYNTLGQKVRTIYRDTPPAGEARTVRLSTTDLSSGVYFLRLQAGAQTETRRVTVVR